MKEDSRRHASWRHGGEVTAAARRALHADPAARSAAAARARALSTCHSIEPY